MKKIMIGMLCAIFILSGCASDSSKKENTTKKEETNQKDVEMIQFEEVKSGDTIALMDTTMGLIKIRLFPEQAPKTVENFITHAKDGYYDGVIFHRVIPDFMIQGGDPEGKGTGGESIWGKAFEDEFSDKLYNFRGALSMANAGPNTNGSQFFIVQNSGIDGGAPTTYPTNVANKYKEVGGTPHLDNKHTVFGQVMEGMDVVDAIATVKTASQDKPVEDIMINKITIEVQK